MARPMFRPIIFALKRAPTWPGILYSPVPDDPAPDGWEYVFDRYGVLRYANDNSPYITDGAQMISLKEYQAGSDEIPNRLDFTRNVNSQYIVLI